VVALAVATGSVIGTWDAPVSARAEEPAAAPKPEPKKSERSKPSIEDMIRIQFGRRADEALRIARCESKLNSKARSYSGARGVFQLMPVHAWRIARVGGKDLYDAKTNIKVAKHLQRDEGWRPWVCARILGVR
jgi:soluble lytic murein transglycosylase-like protein